MFKESASDHFHVRVAINLVGLGLSEENVVLVDGGERLVDGALALRPDGLRLLTYHDLQG